MKYKHIFWDWNGTLFDDLDVSLSSINISLAKRNLPAVDKERYFDLFCFPVQKYYERLGFDFALEDYNDLAVEFIHNYTFESAHADLHKNVKAIVGKLAVCSAKQYILSASEKQILLTDLERYGIKSLFCDIIACDNIYADGKIAMGKKYVSEHNLDGGCLIIGDTVHDYEVASALNFDCILFCRGHAQKSELEKLGVPVICDLLDIFRYIFDKEEFKRYNLEKFCVYRRGIEEEIADYEQKQGEAEQNSSFASDYHAFYNDVKNSRKTEDW